MTVLDRIVARTRADLAGRMARAPRGSIEAGITPSRRSFVEALGAPGLGLIAEFKPASPSKGPIRPGADPAAYARVYSRQAAAISVLTDGPFFGGGHHLLDAFDAHGSRPLLCKDFIVDGYQIVEARAHGADAVLLMASLHDEAALRALLAEARSLQMEALVEAHDEEEIDRAARAGARVVGVNARDLRTLAVDPGRVLALLGRVPAGLLRVAESGVARREQVEALRGLADAVLIGSALMEPEDPAAAIRGLGW